MLRMLAQQALGKLHHHIQPACRLQGGRTPDHSEDGQHHINRRFTGLQTKDKRQNKQTDTAYQPQSHPAKTRACQQAQEDDNKLNGDHDAPSSLIM